LEKSCRLAAILGETDPAVNSLHHQGVDQLGEGLRACGWTKDGLVEALEMPGYPFGLAVQWHPECMPENEAMRRLFKAFVDACG
jgi:putative glutamine amidotransferase